MSKGSCNSSNDTKGSAVALRRVSPLLMLVCLVASFSVHAEYTFQVIEPVEGEYTQVFGINNAGKVVGNTASGYSFIYDMKKDTYTAIDESAIDGDFAILEISNPGVIVGSIENELGQTMCAVRAKDGTITTFSPPINALNPEGTVCQARGVNPDGKVSGFQVDEFGTWSGFIYDPESETYEEFLPSTGTIAHAINAQGQTVGSEWLDDSEVFAGSPAGFYGYLRQVDGFVQYFAITESFPGRTRARGISENGLVTGYLVDPATGEAKGFVTVLLPDTGFQDISVAAENVIFQSPCNPEGPTPAEGFILLGTNVYASQVRNDGVVVGSCEDIYFNPETGQQSGFGYGFIATPSE